MSRIVVSMLYQPGHVNPTFKLAKALRARGHDVMYLALPDVVDHITRQGFEAKPIFPDTLPRGALRVERSTARRATALMRRMLEHAADGALDAALVETKADLVLADVMFLPTVFAAARVGIRTALLNTMFPLRRDGVAPPLDTRLLPGLTPRRRARTRLAWERVALWRRLMSATLAHVGLCLPHDLEVRLARTCGLPPDAIDTSSFLTPTVRGLTEIVLCPEALDFPRSADADLAYAEASIDPARADDGGEAISDLADDGSRLVYCSLGTNMARYPRARRILRAVIEAVAGQRNVRLLVRAGEHAAVLPSSAKVRVLHSVPQLRVLEHAAVMINHGGLGSVKECVMAGVPMIVMPFHWDQPGNAARVAYHGLGTVLSPWCASARTLRAALETVLGNDEMSARSRAMQARFVAAERAQRGVALVERELGIRAAAAE